MKEAAAIILIVTALSLYGARKSIAKAAKRQARKYAKKARAHAWVLIRAIARHTWKGTKALGRELRAQTSWLQERATWGGYRQVAPSAMSAV